MENRKAGSLIPAYLERQGHPLSLTLPETLQDIGQVLVIPCFEEEKIDDCLKSLSECKTPAKNVLVIVVLNQGVTDEGGWTSLNLLSKGLIEKEIPQSPRWMEVLLVEANHLPPKKAGVGLARKIGMDLAANILSNQSNENGPIVCLDADCTVGHNYLSEIENHFQKFPDSPGCSIYFEHPLDLENAQAIILYELQLRYYIEALRWAGYPMAYHTIGSSMAVRAATYAQQGGMNQRKAGEDFYFLHKIIPLQNYTEINSTRVIPSPRVSRRVPFGTGKAMSNFQEKKDDLETYYNLDSFVDIQTFLSVIKNKMESFQEAIESYGLMPDSIRSFVNIAQWKKKMAEIFDNAGSCPSRMKRFYAWVNGFWMLKFIHFSRDNFHPNRSLLGSAAKLLKQRTDLPMGPGLNAEEILLEYRRIQRKFAPSGRERN